MKTNLNEVKNVATQLIYVEPKRVEDYNICKHPYIASPIIKYQITGRFFNIFDDVETFHCWQEQLKNDILHRKNVYSVISLIRPAYRMSFFKNINQYLSDKDFAEMLAVCWSAHDRAEIPETDLELWFKKADKKYLMSKREQKTFNELPEQVVIYRGVCNPEYKYGFSWTLDKKVAIWYANRRENRDFYIYECIVGKKDILCYFDTRNEAEVIINPSLLKTLKIMYSA